MASEFQSAIQVVGKSGCPSMGTCTREEPLHGEDESNGKLPVTGEAWESPTSFFPWLAKLVFSLVSASWLLTCFNYVKFSEKFETYLIALDLLHLLDPASSLWIGHMVARSTPGFCWTGWLTRGVTSLRATRQRNFWTNRPRKLQQSRVKALNERMMSTVRKTVKKKKLRVGKRWKWKYFGGLGGTASIGIFPRAFQTFVEILSSYVVTKLEKWKKKKKIFHLLNWKTRREDHQCLY